MIWALLFLVLFSSWFLPWWIYLVWAFLVGWKTHSAGKAFVTGFLGTGLAWVMVAYYQDMRGESLISERLAGMFSLPHPSLVYVVVLVLSGLSSALFCVAGFYLSEIRPIKRLNA